MSGTWTGWCLEHRQWKMSIFQISDIDVRWTVSKHQLSMSGIWTVSTVHITDITFLIKLMPGKRRLMSSGNWPYFIHQNLISDRQKVSTVHIPDIEHRMSVIWTVMLSVNTVHLPDINFWCQVDGQSPLSRYWTSNTDVVSIGNFYCPCSGYQLLMSGIWKVETVHIANIVRCPKYGQGRLGTWSWTPNESDKFVSSNWSKKVHNIWKTR